MYNEYINHKRIYMNEQINDILETIRSEGQLIVNEGDTSYDDAIHQLLDDNIITWSDTEDDALVLA